MLTGIIHKISGDPHQRALKRVLPIVEQINALEPEMERLGDEQLPGLTEQFRSQLDRALANDRDELARRRDELASETDTDARRALRLELEAMQKGLRQEEESAMQEVLPRAFAAVREASKRTLGLRHYDEQLIGGIVLHQGKVAEMKTGEGKTLVATLPLYLNALLRRGAHLVTPNDYLSKVGVQWMGPVYHLLGMQVAVIQNIGTTPDQPSSFRYNPQYQAADDRYQHLEPVSRAEAYGADITYGTNNEFGFDYLRDNMVWELAHQVQRGLYYAIVDEVDNILIDEARTPLIISGPAEEATDYYRKFAELVRGLNPETDYTIDHKQRVVTATDEGIERVERELRIDNLYSNEHYGLTPYFENALKAEALFKRDVDYIVKDGEVIIVDEFTGRLMPGRRYSEGLHQAIEAKEGVHVQRESMTLATITFQNYFRMYEKLAGMTGTAATEAEEFSRIYNLDVVVIPTHEPVCRTDYPDLVYKTREAKWRAAVDEIAEKHSAGQPVLVGTVAIETSEMLSRMLERRGVKHEVLNAKQHEREAEIIAQAGRPGAVTIATNMAGRGVDILLGGNPEGLARRELRKRGVDLTEIGALEWDDAVQMLRRGEDPTARYAGESNQELARQWSLTSQAKRQVVEAGGLHVVGTERHEARRIDNQLRGRSGRQGDPGSSRFYVSLEDDLMIRFGGERVKSLMTTLGVEDDVPIESGVVTRQIEAAQVKVEGFNFDLRKHLLEYDNVINQQRSVIYEQRAQILNRASLGPIIWGVVEVELARLVDTYTAAEDRQEWDLPGLHQAVRAIFELPASEGVQAWEGLLPHAITERLCAVAEEAYARKTEELGQDMTTLTERMVMLRAVDSLWIRHLTAIDELRTGIGLRAYGQQDPLVTFKREAYDMFQQLNAAIQHEIVYSIFHARPMQTEEAQPRSLRRARAGRGGTMGDGRAEPSRPLRVGDKLGRNDQCWCGSGKKYKHCHLRAEEGREPAPVGARPVAARAGKKRRRR
jgi:preprotein translocase subunit SecA